MDHKEIFSIIDAESEKFVKFWQDICNIESPTEFKPGVDAVCKYFVDAANEYGFKTEIMHNEVSGDCACITLNPDANGVPICFSGHMDTVHPIGLFGNPPTTIDGDIIHGPGVTDCKGGAVACFFALYALYKAGFSARPVKLILQSDEETSSRGSNKKTLEFMKKCAEGSAAFLNTEGYSDGCATLKRKGILRFNLTVTGKAAHSGFCTSGINAIAEASAKILEFEKQKNSDGITFNCGIIRGGTAENTVAEKCEFSLDIRFFTEAEKETAKQLVKTIAETEFIKGTKCEYSLKSERPAMEETEFNLRLFEKLNSAFENCGLKKLTPVPSCGGSDASNMTAAGIPCVDSIGVSGGGIHKKEEFAYISSLPEAAKRLVAAALYV